MPSGLRREHVGERRKREPTFHVSWLLSDGASGEDERINFTCDTEEMLHLVETLREACKASETIAASSA